MTGGSREHFWILSRKPVMDREKLEGILERAKANGFVLDELEYPRHGGTD